jgi:hypothetical protein
LFYMTTVATGVSASWPSSPFIPSTFPAVIPHRCQCHGHGDHPFPSTEPKAERRLTRAEVNWKVVSRVMTSTLMRLVAMFTACCHAHRHLSASNPLPLPLPSQPPSLLTHTMYQDEMDDDEPTSDRDQDDVPYPAFDNPKKRKFSLTETAGGDVRSDERSDGRHVVPGGAGKEKKRRQVQSCSECRRRWVQTSSPSPSSSMDLSTDLPHSLRAERSSATKSEWPYACHRASNNPPVRARLNPRDHRRFPCGPCTSRNDQALCREVEKHTPTT